MSSNCITPKNQMGVIDRLKLPRELFNSYWSRLSLEKVLMAAAVFVFLGSAAWFLCSILRLMNT
ncbi:MAG: hypothetical protein QOI13_1908 [Paraburkholderia sp.]|nr:hypothetical protein [Paraburkholderia sp.]MEA3121422.1 hypothetical protein [Paraburkholderia sp.]